MPEDVKALAPYVLAHRMLLTPEAELRDVRSSRLVDEILGSVPLPQQRSSL